MSLTFVSRFPQLRVQVQTEVLALGIDGKSKLISGPRYAEFQGGSFTATTIEVIEALLTHPSYNRDYHSMFTVDQVRLGEWRKIYEEEHADKTPKSTSKPLSATELAHMKGEAKPVGIKGEPNAGSDPANKPTTSVADILKQVNA